MAPDLFPVPELEPLLVVYDPLLKVCLAAFVVKQCLHCLADVLFPDYSGRTLCHAQRWSPAARLAGCTCISLTTKGSACPFHLLAHHPVCRNACDVHAPCVRAARGLCLLPFSLGLGCTLPPLYLLAVLFAIYGAAAAPFCLIFLLFVCHAVPSYLILIATLAGARL